MKNFKAAVPQAMQNKIKDFADNVDFHSIVSGNRESYGTQTIHEIEGNYVSGWMPKQDGGFSVDEFYSNDIDSSHHFTDKQTEFNNDQSEQCHKAFLHDNGLPEDTAWDDLTEEQKDAFANYENEWFEPALLQLQIYVNGFGTYDTDKDKNVTIRLSINYKDAPYYRENSAEDIKQLVLTHDEFMQTSNEDILKQFHI
jgi:hypothetical protein